MSYEFTVDWFSLNWPNWLMLTEGRCVRSALEIGSFEGLSACKMIEHFGGLGEFDIFCVDTWSGGVEHKGHDMGATERRFEANIAEARSLARHPTRATKLKGFSSDQLLALLAQGRRASFDLVYVDGSHQAPDVLSDLILAYELVRVGGLIICDDYLWSLEEHGKEDLLNSPRLAIDAFKTVFMRRVHQFSLPAYQCFLERTA